MRRRRVAYLLADVGITLWGARKGCSIHARSMIAALADEGAEVDVYVMRTGKNADPKSEDLGERVNIEEVRRGRLTRWWWKRVEQGRGWRWLSPGRPRREGPPNWVTAVGWVLWHRDFEKHVRKGLRRRRADVIYARHAWLAGEYARLQRRAGVPMVLEVNALFAREKADRGELAFAARSEREERRILAAADRIWPVSEQLATACIEEGADPARVEVTPNAVDLERFRPALDGPLPSPDRFVVGSVGSMRGYHGLETLLRAAALLKDEIPGLRLLLIGGGEREQALRELASELGLEEQAEFTGVLAHTRVPLRLRECDVAVSPNEGPVNRYNCPMKLYEYMAMKLPIVASDWGDIPNIVEHERTALLHAPGDPRSLADALRQVRRDPEGARRRAEAAYRDVRHHTWQSLARRVLALAENPE